MDTSYLCKAKKRIDNLWIEGYRMGEHRVLYYDGDDYYTEHVDESTFCKCSGMKDAHDNNIFEHDIIKDVANGVIGEVLYVNLRWVVKILASETTSKRPGFVYDLNSYYNFDAIDIIGNTYESNEIKKEGDRVFVIIYEELEPYINYKNQIEYKPSGVQNRVELTGHSERDVMNRFVDNLKFSNSKPIKFISVFGNY